MISSFPELHEKWEARRAEERARQEAERAERERIAREEAERKAAEEAKRKEEEERLRREQAEEAGEGEEAGDKEEGEEAGEGEEKAKEEEEEGAAGAPAAEAEPKDIETPELQPSGEDLTLGAGPEEEELVLDSDMPPNTPETEEFKNLRTKFDQDFPQLLSVLKGTNNIEPIAVSVEKETDNLNKEVIKRIEGMCVGTGKMQATVVKRNAKQKKKLESFSNHEKGPRTIVICTVDALMVWFTGFQTILRTFNE